MERERVGRERRREFPTLDVSHMSLVNALSSNLEFGISYSTKIFFLQFDPENRVPHFAPVIRQIYIPYLNPPLDPLLNPRTGPIVDHQRKDSFKEWD